MPIPKMDMDAGVKIKKDEEDEKNMILGGS